MSGRHTGASDIPLTDDGREQAKRLRSKLDGRTFAQVLSSPLSRALDTALEAGYSEVVEIDDDLHEWRYGRMEGRTTEEIRDEIPGWTVWSHGVEDGESADQVAEQVDRVIARVHAADGDVALFAHGHILRVLTARWLGRTTDGRPAVRARDGDGVGPGMGARDRGHRALERAGRAGTDAGSGPAVRRSGPATRRAGSGSNSVRTSNRAGSIASTRQPSAKDARSSVR